MNQKQNITDKIKSFEDACNLLEVSPEQFLVENPNEKDRRSLIAYYKLCVITRALNEGWEPDWKNWSEEKWFNYFWTDSASGLAFSGAIFRLRLRTSAPGFALRHVTSPRTPANSSKASI